MISAVIHQNEGRHFGLVDNFSSKSGNGDAEIRGGERIKGRCVGRWGRGPISRKDILRITKPLTLPRR